MAPATLGQAPDQANSPGHEQALMHQTDEAARDAAWAPRSQRPAIGKRFERTTRPAGDQRNRLPLTGPPATTPAQKEKNPLLTKRGEPSREPGHPRAQKRGQAQPSKETSLGTWSINRVDKNYPHFRPSGGRFTQPCISMRGLPAADPMAEPGPHQPAIGLTTRSVHGRPANVRIKPGLPRTNCQLG